MHAICVYARGLPSAVYEGKLQHDSLERTRKRRKEAVTKKEEGLKAGRAKDGGKKSNEIKRALKK